MNHAQKAVDSLTFKFRNSMPDKLGEIEGILTELTYRIQTEALWSKVMRKIHSFIGSSATFGFIEISQSARRLEENVNKLVGLRQANKLELDQTWQIFGMLRSIVEEKVKELSGELVSLECPLTFSSNYLMIKPSKIFILSDDEYFSQWLNSLLTDDNHEVYVVDSPSEALCHKELDKCDFIFSEVILPEMDGYHFAKELRKRQRNQYLPLIFITSITGEMNRLECIKAGGDAVLAKPASIELIRAELFVIRRLIENT